VPFLNVQLRKGHVTPPSPIGLARELPQQQAVTTRLVLVRMLMLTGRSGPGPRADEPHSISFDD
jgi:hypothetical protein